MNKDQQNLAWACLPKEVRDEIKRAYRYQCQNRDYNRGFNEALEEVFGYHNLTSDTEPEEMLMISRKEVQKLHDDFIRDEWYERAACLDELFGDKCLPDKTPEEKAKEIIDTIKEDIENPIQMPETKLNPQPYIKVEPKHVSTEEVCKILGIEKDDSLVRKPDKEPSVQDEPKFNKGDKARFIKNPNKVITVEGYTAVGMVAYYEKGEDGITRINTVNPDFLEPYTEPETKDNTQQNSWDDNFKRFNECCNKIIKTLESLCNSCDKMKDCIDRL